MIYLDFARERDLMHFPDEELLPDWNDVSDADRVVSASCRTLR